MRKTLRSAVQSSLRFKRYPYTYARVMVMKGRLLDRGDYDRLARLSLTGIIKLLQDTDYRAEIDRLAIRHEGIALLEHALHANLIATYTKLRSISSEELTTLFDAYLLRHDVQNIKDILRGLHAGLPKSRIAEMVSPVCFTQEEYDELLSAGTIEDVLSRLQFIPLSAFEDGLARYGAFKSLDLIEAVLDQHFFLRMLAAAKQIPQQGQLLRNMLLQEIDLLNLKAILRLRAADVAAEHVEKVVIFRGGRLKPALLRRLLHLDLAQALQECGGTPYGELFKGAADLTSLEVKIDRYLLRHSLAFIHGHPLPANIIVGYLFAKEVEVRNLRLLGKATHLGLGQDFVQEGLVV